MPSGFFRRSRHLLFAVIAPEHAYFVDIRPHPRPNPEDVGWVEQDLVRIVYSNWPELITPSVLRGVKGTAQADKLTDKQRLELRNKNINYLTEMDGQVIAPMGGGMTARGSSVLCMLAADNILEEVKWHQRYLDAQPTELRDALTAKGLGVTDKMQFTVVLLDSLETSDELTESLRKSALGKWGLVIVERTTNLPVLVARKDSAPAGGGTEGEVVGVP